MKLNELASENLRGVFRIERLNQLNRKAMRDNATYSILYAQKFMIVPSLSIRD